ncbi:hypothetical protein K0U07_05430 [bacterium]|nr:hypothetical protein [bacterium]
MGNLLADLTKNILGNMPSGPYKFGHFTKGVIKTIRGEKPVKVKPADKALQFFFELHKDKEKTLTEKDFVNIASNLDTVDGEITTLEEMEAELAEKTALDSPLFGEEKDLLLDKLVKVRGRLIYFRLIKNKL